MDSELDRKDLRKETSIKEDIEQNLGILMNEKSCGAIAVTRSFKGKQDLVEWGIEFGNENQTEVEKGYGKVIFDEKRISLGFRYISKTDLDAQYALALVPDIVKAGKEIGHHDKHKNREYDTTTFGGNVVINGKKYLMAVVVREEDRLYYKTHRIVEYDAIENKKETLLKGRARVKNNSNLSPADNVSNNSISDLSANVNTVFTQEVVDRVQSSMMGDTFLKKI